VRFASFVIEIMNRLLHLVNEEIQKGEKFI